MVKNYKKNILKLELIEDYIKLNQIKNINNILSQNGEIEEIKTQCIYLISIYEKVFIQLNMVDESLRILKKEFSCREKFCCNFEDAAKYKSRLNEIQENLYKKFQCLNNYYPNLSSLIL